MKETETEPSTPSDVQADDFNNDVTDEMITGEAPFDLHERLRLVTRNSIWLLEPDVGDAAGFYVRMPKIESMRAQPPSVNNRLQDGVRHGYRKLFWMIDERGICLRIVPAVGPEDGMGIVTSDIMSAEPAHLLPRRTSQHRLEENES